MWDDEKLIGCGALKFLDKEHGEFKSIRIHDNFRNKGYGISVINHLINEAKKLKIKKLSIETGAGDFFLPARKLFKKCKFEECQPFAHYKEDVNSVLSLRRASLFGGKKTMLSGKLMLQWNLEPSISE